MANWQDEETELDRNLLVIPKCFVYRIPPKRTSAGHRAADWNVKEPNWTGRLEIIAREQRCHINFIDDNGKLFATAPVSSTNPKETVEKVTDSGRYFVVRIASGNKTASIGVGFADRAESFDFRSVIQDWEQRVAEEKDALSKPVDFGPQTDMSLKGTIKVKAPIISRKPGTASSALSSSGPSAAFATPTNGALLAPPPSSGGRRRRGGAGAATQRPQTQFQLQQSQAPTHDPLGGLGDLAPAPAPAAQQNSNTNSASDFDFGDISTPAPAQAAAPAPHDPFAMF